MAGPYLPLDTKDTRQQPPVTWPPCWQHCHWQVPPASSRPWGMGLRCRSPRLGQDSPPFRVISIPLAWPTGVPQIKWINSSPRGSLGLTPCCRGLNENVLGAYRHSHDYSLTLEDTQAWQTGEREGGTGGMSWISKVCFQSKPICSFVASKYIFPPDLYSTSWFFCCLTILNYVIICFKVVLFTPHFSQSESKHLPKLPLASGRVTSGMQKDDGFVP